MTPIRSPQAAARAARPTARRAVARTLLFAALVGASLSLRAADALPNPFAAAASAFRSALGEAARPVVSAASAVRDAASAPPKGAGLAASAVQVVQVVQAVKEAFEPTRPTGGASSPASASASAAASASAPAAPSSAAVVAGPATAAPPAAVASHPLSATASPSACLRPADVRATCQADTQQLPLELTTIPLPTARVGSAYKPRRLVTGGVLPYAFRLSDGTQPEGLTFTADGALGGTPSGPPGLHRFTVQATDSSVPPLSVRQTYALRVDPPAGPRKAAPPVTSPPPAPPVPASAPGPAQITSYMLLQEDLDDMFPKAAPPPDAAASDAPPAEPRRRARPKAAAQPVAYGDKMHAMLAPMLNIDYPTAELFGSALEARRCAHFTALVSEAAKASAAPVDVTCPPAGTTASGLVPPTLYADLLPDTVKRDLVARAAWPHLLSEAKPVSWTDNGCGCAPPYSTELTYGLYPFWQARDKEVQQVQFELFERIGYLGAQITDTGETLLAGQLDPGHADFIRTARRFGTHVDLVLQRSEWTTLLSRPNTEEVLNRAVHDTMALVDTPLTDPATRAKRYLLPFWDEPTALFDGITVFFDNAPTDPAGKEKFRFFYRSFVHKLVAAMQKNGRAYALNIVVPDSLLGDDGAYSFEQLMNYIQIAEKPTNRRLPEGSAAVDYIGTTDITVALLVWVREPTGEAKKALRARVDNTEVIQGHRRVAFLNAMVPVMFHSGGEPAAKPDSVDPVRLDLDLAYIKWQYGGVGFLPLPLAGTGNGGTINRVVEKNYSPIAPPKFSGVCRIVCPHRTAVRLLFMGLLLTGIVALGLYTWVCSVRRLGRGYVVCLWLGGLATLAVALGLLGCDPQLATLREGNIPLFALLASTVAVGMYYSLKPRVAPP